MNVEEERKVASTAPMVEHIYRYCLFPFVSRVFTRNGIYRARASESRLAPLKTTSLPSLPLLSVSLSFSFSLLPPPSPFLPLFIILIGD